MNQEIVMKDLERELRRLKFQHEQLRFKFSLQDKREILLKFKNLIFHQSELYYQIYLKYQKNQEQLKNSQLHLQSKIEQEKMFSDFILKKQFKFIMNSSSISLIEEKDELFEDSSKSEEEMEQVMKEQIAEMEQRYAEMFELKAIEMMEGFQQREMEYQRQIESLKKMLNLRKEEMVNESINQLDQLDQELNINELREPQKNQQRKKVKETNQELEDLKLQKNFLENENKKIKVEVCQLKSILNLKQRKIKDLKEQIQVIKDQQDIKEVQRKQSPGKVVLKSQLKEQEEKNRELWNQVDQQKQKIVVLEGQNEHLKIQLNQLFQQGNQKDQKKDQNLIKDLSDSEEDFIQLQPRIIQQQENQKQQRKFKVENPLKILNQNKQKILISQEIEKNYNKIEPIQNQQQINHFDHKIVSSFEDHRTLILTEIIPILVKGEQDVLKQQIQEEKLKKQFEVYIKFIQLVHPYKIQNYQQTQFLSNLVQSKDLNDISQQIKKQIKMIQIFQQQNKELITLIQRKQYLKQLLAIEEKQKSFQVFYKENLQNLKSLHGVYQKLKDQLKITLIQDQDFVQFYAKEIEEQTLKLIQYQKKYQQVKNKKIS